MNSSANSWIGSRARPERRIRPFPSGQPIPPDGERYHARSRPPERLEFAAFFLRDLSQRRSAMSATAWGFSSRGSPRRGDTGSIQRGTAIRCTYEEVCSGTAGLAEAVEIEPISGVDRMRDAGYKRGG